MLYVRTIYFISLVAICINFINGHTHKRIRLNLENGQIEGKQVKTVDKGKSYYSFQGIPYAKPPLGALRFAAPQPADKWSTVLDATKPGNTCIEIHQSGGNEDCLYLNVYTPSLNKSLPVIVWIHGGGFVFIFDNYTLYGVDYFIDEEVILVTIHYRLGVFGFLSTEDDTIPGNFGLKDQVMAVEWIHKNIQVFGGDSNKITVMGQSAGATSTAFMGMIPQLDGKIHGIIQQSGSSICPFSLGRYARVGAYVLSTRLGVPQNMNSSLILEELRQIDAETLRNTSLITHPDIVYGTGSFHGLLYIPVLEPRTNKDALLTEMFYEQLKEGRFNKIPRLIGINSFEGLFIVDEFNSLSKYYNNYDQIIKRYIPVDMNSRSEKVGHLIKKYYTNDTPFISNITNMVRLGSDDQFVRPILKDASLVSKHVTTYLYQFSYEGKLGNPNRQLKGVDHGEELKYLFYDQNKGRVSKEDKLVRLKLVRLWCNFAKHSNPTPNKEKLLDDKIWLPINPNSDDVNYIDIGSKLVPSINPHQNDVEFWDNLYNTYGNPPFDTY